MPKHLYYIHYQSTIKFKVEFCILRPIHSECNMVLDFTKFLFLYFTLLLQSLYIHYQSTVILKVYLNRLCPIHSKYNKVMDFTKLVCLY